MEMAIADILTLLAFASKVCEFEDRLRFEYDVNSAVPLDRQEVDRIQLESLSASAKDILKRFDTTYPGIVALPHDNIPWRKR